MRALIIVILLLGACTNPEKLPISETKMVEVLSDMMIAEAAMNRADRSVEDSLELSYYNQIYRIHAIDSNQLNKSFEILQANPELANRLYKMVEERLEGIEKKRAQTKGAEPK